MEVYSRKPTTLLYNTTLQHYFTTLLYYTTLLHYFTTLLYREPPHGGVLEEARRGGETVAGAVCPHPVHPQGVPLTSEAGLT